MSEAIAIKSQLRDYKALFVNDFRTPLQTLVKENGFFIVDSVIWEIYREKLADVVPHARLLVVEANENNKSLEQCHRIIETLVAKQFRRNEKLVAIGGGIIQDVTAFSASILYRGVEWFFSPTTLLAQADSCIGSKTSINFGDKKNLVGNFYPPSAIFIDTLFLESLDIADIKSGIGEIMHYYVYAGGSYLNEIADDYKKLIDDRWLLAKHIRQSLSIKKAVIEVDEFDKKERNKFNYGHTFGHALESVTDYGLKHGQAVTVGMDLANYVSLKYGFMNKETYRYVHEKISVNFPDYGLKDIDLNRYLSLLLQDKKNEGKNVGCILAEKPGSLFKKQMPADDDFRKIIRSYFLEELNRS